MSEAFSSFLQVRVIPLELQRLFASLLLADQQSASTADLTDSFGWNSTEVLLVHKLSARQIYVCKKIAFKAKPDACLLCWYENA